MKRGVRLNEVEAMQKWRGSNARMAWKQCKNGVETMQEWRGSNVRMAWKRGFMGILTMLESGGQLTFGYLIIT